MPQAFALALFNLGAPLAAVNAVLGIGFAGTVLYAAGNIAISVGASYLLGLALRPKLPTPSDGQQEFQQPVPPRAWHYGRMKVAGPVAFYDASPVAPRELWRIILLSSREIDAIESQWLDDTLVVPDGTGLIPDEFGGFVHLYTHLGTDTQAADAPMMTAFPAHWTSNHRLRGVAYAVASYNQGGNIDNFNYAYTNGVPIYNALIRGAKVYDPRLDSTVPGGSGAHRHANKATWTWSENPALCILDFLTYVDGYNRPIAKIDLPSFMNMADICNTAIPLKAGGTEPRYRIGTTVYLTEARKDVLARLLEACDATLQPTSDGKWRIVGGVWAAPTVTLDATAGHIIEAEISVVPALDRYNELAIQYMSPSHSYTEVEGDPWIGELGPVGPGPFGEGITETRPLDLMQVPSHGQARRLAKLRLARDNPKWIGEIRTNVYGLDAIGERLIRLRWPLLDIDEPFWVEAMSAYGDGTGATIRIRSASEASYAWNAALEEGTAPPIPPDISGGLGTPPPDND